MPRRDEIEERMKELEKEHEELIRSRKFRLWIALPIVAAIAASALLGFAVIHFRDVSAGIAAVAVASAAYGLKEALTSLYAAKRITLLNKALSIQTSASDDAQIRRAVEILLRAEDDAEDPK